MEVKFDLVRIGNIRKERNSETILKQNIDSLRSAIRSLLKDIDINNKSNKINMVMVIPGKGYNIKIALKDIQDESIKKQLRDNFPNSIYKGEYSTIMENIDNKIFGGY